MEFSWPGEKLLIKLCDTIAGKGIGSLLKPWQMRREGVAAAEMKRLNSLTLAQTKIEVGEIQSGKKVLLPGGKLEAVALVEQEALPSARIAIIAELEEIVRTNVLNEAFRKEVSVAKAVLFAEQELEQETQAPSDVPISDDWLLRWRDDAASVSSDELQALWGKVLAGEVKNPGSFSLRTLDFLRNVSADDAKLIEKVAPYVTQAVIFRPPATTQLGEITFSELLELQDIGILSGVEALGMQSKFSSVITGSYVQPLTCHGRVVLVTHVDESQILTIPIYNVTRIGREVLKLGWKRPNEAYLKLLAERIKGMGFETEIGDYVEAGNGSINISNLKKV